MTPQGGLELFFAPLLAHLHKGSSAQRKNTLQALHLRLSIGSSISTADSTLQGDAAQFPARCAQQRRFVNELFSAVQYMWILIQNITRSCSGLKKKKKKDRGRNSCRKSRNTVVDAVGYEEWQTRDNEK